MTHTENNELTTGPGAPYAVGELVDITIRGARIMHTYLWSTVVDLGVENEVEIVDRPGITYARVAPAEWPPQPADVWRDRNGNAWAALRNSTSGQMEMGATNDSRSLWADPGELLAEVGPMRLEYRHGWTRQPDPDPAVPADPDKVDERTATIAGLRAMANFLEANPGLPRTYGWGGQLRAESEQHLRDLAEEFGATLKYDIPDAIAMEIRQGKAALVLYYPKPQPTPVVDEMPDVPPEFTAEQVAAEVPAAVVELADQVGAVLDGPILRTPAEWLRQTPGLVIYDADGWRGANGRSWHDPITEDEFGRRLAVSTISTGDDEDGRCPSTVDDETKPGGLHYCELYGTHDQVRHVCICGHEWPVADQPVPAPRDAAE